MSINSIHDLDYMLAFLPRWRSALLTSSLLLFLVVSAMPRGVEAIELLGMGGMGVNFWSMDVSLAGRAHQSVGVGVTGRVHLKIGPYSRIQAGLVQGRFTEDDASQVKRNLIYAAGEGVYHVSEHVYFTAGLRLGGDHLDISETLETLDDDRRVVRDSDQWFFLWEPFLTIGFRLAEKYHFELETGMACSLINGRVNVSTIITLGIFFRMGGRS